MEGAFWNALKEVAVAQNITAAALVSKIDSERERRRFRSRVVCAKCGSRGNKIDVRPNWKEQPPSESLTGKVWR